MEEYQVSNILDKFGHYKPHLLMAIIPHKNIVEFIAAQNEKSTYKPEAIRTRLLTRQGTVNMIPVC
jgi:hypothetical protein